MESVNKKTRLERFKEWYKYLEIKEYFIRLFWRIAFIPLLFIMMVFGFPIALMSQCVVWLFTGDKYLNYFEDLMLWSGKNIWDKAFPDY